MATIKNKNDENIINSILQSSEMKDLIKKLVEGEIQNSGNQESAIQKLSEIFRCSSLYENTSQLKSSKHSSIIPIHDLRSDKIVYSEEEITLRCSLASLFRLFDMEGWAKSIYNLISFRVSAEFNEYFINPFGLLYHEITAASILKIDKNGLILDNGCTVLGLNKKNWIMHEAIYDARKDVKCIVQLSLPDVVAVSSIKSGLLPVSLEAIKLLDISPNSLSCGGVKYHQILHDSSDNQFRKLIDDLGNSKILFLRNNGLLVCASSIAEVWVLTKTVVTACKAQIRLIQLGGRDLLHSECNFTKTNTLFSDINLELNHSGYKTVTDTNLDSELEFEAMMRLLDKAGYRTGHKYTNKQFNFDPVKCISMNGDAETYEENKEIVQICPVPHSDDVPNNFIPDEHTVQICPMPPANEDTVNFEPDYNEQERPALDEVDETDSLINGDDSSLRERELVKEICAEVIDNSIKFCEKESNFQVSVDDTKDMQNKFDLVEPEHEDVIRLENLDVEKSSSFKERVHVKEKSATISTLRSKSFAIADKHSKNKTLEFHDAQDDASNSKIKKRHTFRASNFLKFFHKKL